MNLAKIPRQPTTRCLFAAYILSHPFKPQYQKYVENEDLSQMTKLIVDKLTEKSFKQEKSLFHSMSQCSNITKIQIDIAKQLYEVTEM